MQEILFSKDEASYLSSRADVGSLLTAADRKRAADYLLQGKLVGVFNRGVCAIWADGRREGIVELISSVKGESREKRPLALTLPFEELVDMIDLGRVSPVLASVFKDPCELKRRIGSLCFLRLPIKVSCVDKLPSACVSLNRQGLPVVQNWDPSGHRSTRLLVEGFRERGVHWPVVTSMNISGEPEIVGQLKGYEFCKKSGIPIFLTDFSVNPFLIGSYTILSADGDGMLLMREGNIPSVFLEKVLQVDLNRSEAVGPNYPHIAFPVELTYGFSPRAVRLAILLFLSGAQIDRIVNRLKNFE